MRWDDGGASWVLNCEAIIWVRIRTTPLCAPNPGRAICKFTSLFVPTSTYHWEIFCCTNVTRPGVAGQRGEFIYLWSYEHHDLGNLERAKWLARVFWCIELMLPCPKDRVEPLSLSLVSSRRGARGLGPFSFVNVSTIYGYVNLFHLVRGALLL